MIKEYEKYKNSDIEWFDKIPEHWNCYKLKYLGYLYSGLTGKKGDDFYDEESPLSRRYINFKNIANNSKININEFDLVIINKGEEQNLVQKGDLFFLMSSENFDDIAKTAILDEEMEETYLNSFCRGFRINIVDVSPQFVNYALSGNIYRQVLSNQAKGFTRINIQVGKIENFSIYLPSYDEQITITSFLDHQTALIDEIITRKEKQIELLKEKRQAIINETVTKGLNPDAKMKDSGIEWLGEIPEHWNNVRIGHYVQIVRGASPRPAGDPKYFGGDFIPWITVGEVTNGDSKFLFETENYLTEEGGKQSRIILPETLLLSNSGATLGVPKISKIKGCINDGSVAFLNFNPQLKRDYLFYFFKSHTEIYRKEMSGYGQPNLNTDIIKSTIIPLPPVNEQISIVEFIENKLSSFIDLVNSISVQIEKLKEYRQSIISEAVTGKIDVRDWQPNNA